MLWVYDRLKFLIYLSQFKKSKIEKYYNTILSITHRIDISQSCGMISRNKMKHYLHQCEEVVELCKSTAKLSSILNITKNIIVVNSNLETCKNKIKAICVECGVYEITDFLYLLDINNSYNKEYLEILSFLNKMFNPINCECISKDNPIIKDLHLENNNVPTCFPQKKILISIIEHVRGCRIFLPHPDKDYHIIISGYFKKDMFNISRISGYLKDKHNIIISKLSKLSIPGSFCEGYIKQLSIRDFFVYNSKQIIEKTKKSYQNLCILKDKPISNLVKEFLTKNIEQQRDILTLLLLTHDDIEIQYLAYLLYDMISNESYLLKPQPLSERIYNSLHWSIQKIFKHTLHNLSKCPGHISFQLEELPVENRICLMKADDKIKAKAMDKFKEIQNKNGEQTVKAEQYLDGILRIPFGIYRKEDILTELNNIKSIINGNQYECFRIKDSDFTNDRGIQDVVNVVNKCCSGIANSLSVIPNELINSLKKNKINDTRERMENETFIDKYIKMKKNNLITFIINNWNTMPSKAKISWLKIAGLKIDKYTDNNDWTILINKWDNYKLTSKNYITNARNIMDKAVYKQDVAKKEIERILAQWISGKNDGYCFGFEGPPGTGKTSLAKEGIANCLVDINGEKRPFAFIAVGGSSNASTFEGHSYTYVGSTWGKIVDILMNAECMNPIIYIDELDKISKTEHGKEIIGILTHMTDSSQNSHFSDKYFSGIPFDLSKVLFIFSYNDFSLIDPILADRIHRVHFHTLEKNEKVQIVKKYMLPELLKMIGFNENAIHFNDDVLIWLIDTYTYEAGVRKLKERIFEIIREYNLRAIMGNINSKTIVVSKEDIEEIFESKNKIIKTKIPLSSSIGLVNGLYATTAGCGGITMIEAYKTLSDQMLSLTITGQQGNVMKESVQCAKTIAWNLLSAEEQMTLRRKYKKEPWGIHIHCPEASVPKDGPSAGGAITLAIYSLLTDVKVNHKIALTGEIDLNGKILKIGGLEHKIDGAINAGVEMVLFPYENSADIQLLEKKKPNIRMEIELIPIKTIEEILDYCLI